MKHGCDKCGSVQWSKGHGTNSGGQIDTDYGVCKSRYVWFRVQYICKDGNSEGCLKMKSAL